MTKRKVFFESQIPPQNRVPLVKFEMKTVDDTQLSNTINSFLILFIVTIF